MAGTHIGVDCNYGIDRKIQMARWQRLQTVWIGKIDEPGDFGILGRECESEATGFGNCEATPQWRPLTSCC
jgi:hypothetical protein